MCNRKSVVSFFKNLSAHFAPHNIRLQSNDGNILECRLLTVTRPRLYLKKLLENGPLKAPALVVMYQYRKSNTVVSEAESNPRGINQHGGASGSSAVPAVRQRKSRKGCGSKESIDKRRACSGNVYMDEQFDVVTGINPHGFVPYMLPIANPYLHAQLQLPPYTLYQPLYNNVTHQELNSMYFRRRGTSAKASDDCSSATHGSPRSWQNTAMGAKVVEESRRSQGMDFSIMNYNVLAQDLLQLHPELYQRHDKRNLKWEWRWHNLLQEIKEHDCDILCLQEVQGSHLKTYYKQLEDLGYSGLYKQRTGSRSDGCAIYYKNNVFQLIEHVTVEYRQPEASILNRDNVAIIAKFAPIHNSSAHFVVATTHLLYNPRREDVRLAQSQVLLAEVERFAYENRQKSNYVPVIITGDFNSTPESTICELLSRGKTNYANIPAFKKNKYDVGKRLISPNLRITDNCEHADLLPYRWNDEILNREEEMKVISLQHSERAEVKKSTPDTDTSCNGYLTQKFKFKSVYVAKNFVEEGTSYQDRWVTVDYIFYSGKSHKQRFRDHKLILMAHYALPTGDHLRSLVIPNERLGSDHLSLVAKFRWEF